MTASPHSAVHVPHIELVLRGLQVPRARLLGRTKIAIDTTLLRALLQSLAATLPFDATFYRTRYPDIDAAHRAGEITDLRRHFIETGYLEGRFGAPPEVDEAFYLAAYPDIAEAVRRGEVPSATEHYLRSGAAEGRVPTQAARDEVERWAGVVGV